MCKGEDEESEKTEKRDGDRREREERGMGGGILLISPLRALDKRGMRMTPALYSPAYYPYDRADLAFYLSGRLLQRLSFACCHDEDIDLTPRYTRIARGTRGEERGGGRGRGEGGRGSSREWLQTSRC